MPYKNNEDKKRSNHEGYLRNQEVTKEKARTAYVKRRDWFKQFRSSLSCINCPEDDETCLDFHHVNEDEKTENISKILRSRTSIRRVIDELEKCVCLCANCHRKYHGGKLIIDNINDQRICISLEELVRMKMAYPSKHSS